MPCALTGDLYAWDAIGQFRQSFSIVVLEFLLRRFLCNLVLIGCFGQFPLDYGYRFIEFGENSDDRNCKTFRLQLTCRIPYLSDSGTRKLFLQPSRKESLRTLEIRCKA